MKFKELLTETYECVKIGGILRNLTNDEMKIYKKVKDEGRVFKLDLPEYEANVATTMVSKGLLRRKKAQQDEGHGRIYYTSIGRKGHLKGGELDEVAPPGKESEKWIKKNKKRFKEKYGKDYEKYLYGKAWNNYNGKKKLKESVDISSFSENDIDYFKRFARAYEKLAVACNGRGDPDSDIFYAMFQLAERFDMLDSQGKDAFPDYRRIESYISNQLEEITSHIRDNTADNCDANDYAVYDEGEYDSEGTMEQIENDFGRGIYDVMDDYMPSRIACEAIKVFRKELVDLRINYRANNSEPEFNGDFDSVQTPENPEDDENYKETIDQINEFISKCDAAIERDTASGAIETVFEIKNLNDDNSQDLGDEISDAVHNFEQAGWDYVNDYMYSEDYSFIRRGEDEYNSDATWDRIYDASIEDLYRDYGNYSDATDLRDACEDAYTIIKQILNEPIENDENNQQVQQQSIPIENDEAGSEYNE